MTESARREPAFNVPLSILVYAAILIAVHVLRAFLPRQADFELILTFAFLPLRYVATDLPGGAAADVWTFVTYSVLHADGVHLAVNLLWLVAFGPPVAWRFGPVRLAVFCLAAAVAGAAVHLVSHWAEPVPMIGASAVVSGLMAAAVRFAFVRGGPIGGLGGQGAAAYRQPAMSLSDSFSDPRILAFVGVWLVINLVFGLGSVGIAGEGGAIAWEAHVGGFAVGLLLFSLFDPVRPGPSLGTGEERRP